MLLTAAVALVLLFVLLQGCAAPDVGLSEAGRLAPCPSSPNCVTSDVAPGADEDSFIPPFEIPAGEDPRAAFERLVAIVEGEARVSERRDDYVHAVYTTRFLRFRDDLELRLDAEAHVVHVRSASRVGYSDLGKNRRRVEGLRAAFAAGAR